jgi:hypothetical protein
VPGRIVHLSEAQLDSLREISERFVDRAALAGNVDLRHRAMYQSSSRCKAAVRVPGISGTFTE